MPSDATNEPNPPPLRRYGTKYAATFHPGDGPTSDDDCECDGYPGSVCGCWQRRATRAET